MKFFKKSPIELILHFTIDKRNHSFRYSWERYYPTRNSLLPRSSIVSLLHLCNERTLSIPIPLIRLHCPDRVSLVLDFSRPNWSRHTFVRPSQWYRTIIPSSQGHKLTIVEKCSGISSLWLRFIYIFRTYLSMGDKYNN